MSLKLLRFDTHICPLDLITDGETGRLSTVKIWQHVGNAIMCKVMLTQESVGWELMLSFGAVVSGSYVAINLFKWRFRDGNGIDTTGVSKNAL